MTRLIRPLLAVLLLTNALPLFAGQGDQSQRPSEKYKKGHSSHGAAYDTGPRQKPWAMEGIGKVNFPITSSNPESQKWFNQGIALLHSFWYYEAERAFRWVLKLDPECAMAYWAMAVTVNDDDRGKSFIQEAAKRKNKVSERERMYIEAWEASYPTELPREAGGNEATYDARRNRFRNLLEQVVLKYPDDIEALAFLGLEFMGQNRYGTDLILKKIIARDSVHPGAHHYRIHNWDGKDGKQALDSCAAYGNIAPQIGHAQHMPGHIYSSVGMWHEGAISMDGATRVERNYMKQRLAFPFDTWNYAHNQNYLCYIQEQLGMAGAAISGARQILAGPLDPKYNNPDEYSAHWQGVIAMMRGLIKFERWKELLDSKTFYWRDIARDKMYRAYCEAQAYIGLGDLEKAAKSYAEHAALKSETEKPENRWLEQTYTIQGLEIKALLALAKGETLNGMTLLGDAAKREFEQRERQNDPPSYPTVIYNTLGRVYFSQKSYLLSAEAFEKTLELVRNDGFALSGLAEAYTAMGEKDKAREAYARLLHVWGDADSGLKWMERAKALGIKAEQKDVSPGPQRNYKKTVLDHLGPNVWEPYEAPELAALDPDSKPVKLADFKGKNVLLIFYLGEECPHCMVQLREVAKRYKDFEGLDTEVLAVSSDKPEENAESLKEGDIPFRLLSDVNLENAKRYKSYDDFEELALHSTILIDSRGRVHWARTGGDPFMDLDFLVKEIQRMNQKSPKSSDITPTPTSSSAKQ
jgi:peroxiredoxin